VVCDWFPAGHLTPYVGRPCGARRARVAAAGKNGVSTSSASIGFDPAKRNRYRTERIRRALPQRFCASRAAQIAFRPAGACQSQRRDGLLGPSCAWRTSVIARAKRNAAPSTRSPGYNESLPNWVKFRTSPKWREAPAASAAASNDALFKKMIALTVRAEFLSDRLAATPISKRSTPELSSRTPLTSGQRDYRITLEGIGRRIHW